MLYLPSLLRDSIIVLILQMRKQGYKQWHDQPETTELLKLCLKQCPEPVLPIKTEGLFWVVVFSIQAQPFPALYFHF